MAFSHDSTLITATGNETGDSLRSYIAANSATGEVNGRTIQFARSLRVGHQATFEDENFAYVFPNVYHLDFDHSARPQRVTFEDGTIVYSGGGKGHTTQLTADVIEMSNIQFRVESITNGQRTDLFAPVAAELRFQDVVFVAYGTNSSTFVVLHQVTTGGTVDNLRLIVPNSNGRMQAVFSASNGNTLYVTNGKFSAQLENIAPSGSGSLTAVTRFEKLDWAATTWDFPNMDRGQLFVLVDPVKPPGWVRYEGSKGPGHDVYEVHTHNVNVVDASRVAVAGFKVQLRRSNGQTVLYDVVTGADGAIPAQEVKTYEQTSSNTWVQHSRFQLSAISYRHRIIRGVRDLQDGAIDETLLAVDDPSVTETSKTVVDGYRVINSAARFYDRAKAYLVDNYAGESGTLVTRSGDEIDAGALNVILDPSAAVFVVTATSITIDPGESAFSGSIRTTGVVTVMDHTSVDGTIIDANGDSTLTFLTPIDSWKIFGSAEDRDCLENPTASGTSADRYRFLFASGTTIYVAAIVGVDTVRMNVVPTAAGNTNVDLTVQGQLTALPSRIVTAMEAAGTRLTEIWQRLDLDRANPNVHTVDNTRITNNDTIDITRTDDPNDANRFTVTRQA